MIDPTTEDQAVSAVPPSIQPVAIDYKLDASAKSMALQEPAPTPEPFEPPSQMADALRKSAEGMFNQNRQDLNSSIFQATSKNPDEEAAAQKLGAATGVGSGIALRNKDELARRKAMDDARNLDLIKNNPLLADKLIADPQFAAVAHDDLSWWDKYGKLAHSVMFPISNPAWFAESVMQTSMGKAFTGGMQVPQITELQREQALSPNGELTPEREQELQALEAQQAQTQQETGGMLNTPASMAGNIVGMGESLAKYTTAGATIGGTAGLLGGPFAEVTVPGGIIAGGTSGFSIGMATEFSKQAMYANYRQSRLQGISHEQALSNARIVGVANAVFNAGAIKLVGAPIGAAISSLAAPVTESVVVPTAKAILIDYLKAYGLHEIGAFGLGAGLKASEIGAAKISGIKTTEGAMNIAEEILTSGAHTAYDFALLNALFPLLPAAAQYRVLKDSEMRQLKFKAKIKFVAENNKTKKRSPEQMQNGIESVTPESEQFVYVDRDQLNNVLMQSGASAKEIEQILPGVLAQLQAENPEIAINSAHYLANEVASTNIGKALEPNLRMEKGGLSPNEILQQNIDDSRVRAESKAAVEQYAKLNAGFVESAQKVEDLYFKQLVAAGYKEQEARFHASMIRDFYAVIAAREKKTPEQVQAERPYTIVSEQQARERQAAQAAQQAQAQGSFEQAAIANVGTVTKTMNLIRSKAIENAMATGVSKTKAAKAGQEAVQAWIDSNQNAYAKYKLDKDYQESAALQKATAETTAKIDLLLSEANDALISAGFVLERNQEGTSKSRYYQKGNLRVRVSDHEIPLTPERQYNRETMGEPWKDFVVAKENKRGVSVQEEKIAELKNWIAEQETQDGQQDPNILRQEAVPATFYSALSVEVGKSTTKSASADSWKQQIKGLIAKGVVKEKEVYWSGLDNWLDLQEGKITKEQIQAFLDAGGVRVEVERSKDEQSASELTARQAIANAKEGLGGLLDLELENTFNEYEELVINNLQNSETAKDRARRVELEEVIDEALDAVDMKMVWEFEAAEEQESASFANVFEPKYAGYQLPGGTNYREAVVVLPSKNPNAYSITDENNNIVETFPDWESALKGMQKYRDAGGSEYASISKTNKLGKSNFQSMHWDQPNVLVHLRLNDRVDADSKKVLFVEEVQSDWGQAGREEGFIVSPKLIAAMQTEYESLVYKNAEAVNASTKPLLKDVQRAQELETELLKSDKSRILRAPFVETTSGWLELGLKQILLEAVNGGYDRVAFVDGDQSVQRYRQALTQAVDEIEITRNDDGTYTYSAIKNGAPVQGEQSVSANRINEVFGKAGSKQLLEEADAKPDEIHTIASGDIEIGGEGMRKFYDTIVPQALGKMLKKLGGDKIVEVNIGKSTGKKINAKEYADEAVKLIKGDIDVDEFSDNLGIEEGDIPNVWINELMDLPSRIPKAEARKIAIEFAAKVKVRFAGGKSMTQQGFTVTPALAEQVSQGLPLFQAAKGPPAGTYDPAKMLTTILKSGNKSTLIHETAHFFLHMAMDTASKESSSLEAKQDAQILLDWFGVKDIATWNAMTLEEQRQHHEAFALNWEIYVHEGKAPSVGLQKIFDAFSRYLKRLYVSILTELNEVHRNNFGVDLPSLTPEVKSVMDRMLATDAQISQREAIDNIKAQWETQEESGMNDGEWAALKEMEREAHDQAESDLNKASLKQVEWLTKATERLNTQAMMEFKRLRKTVSAEETAKMEKEPLRQAENFLKTGKMLDADGNEVQVPDGYKLDRSAVASMYAGKAFPPDLTKLSDQKMLADGGMNPDIAAEQFGFSSGDELIRKLVDQKPFKDELQERTDARMEDEHGDLNTEEARQDAANQALHNELRARYIAVQNRFRNKIKTPVAQLMIAVKERAQEILAKMKLKDIRPSEFSSAEAREAKTQQDAHKAMQSPDTAYKTAYTRSYNEQIAAGVEEAVAVATALEKGKAAAEKAQAKIDAHKEKYGDVMPEMVARKAGDLQELYNRLAKDAFDIKDSISRFVKYTKNVLSDDNRKRMGADASEQIEGILSRFGLIPPGKEPKMTLEQWVTQQTDKGLPPDIAPSILLKQYSMPFSEMTVEEFADLKDAVKYIEHVSKYENKAMKAARNKSFADFVPLVVKSVLEQNPRLIPFARRTARTGTEKANEAVAKFGLGQQRGGMMIRIIDGDKDGGIVSKFLLHTMDAQTEVESEFVTKTTKVLDGLLRPVLAEGKMGGSGELFPNLKSDAFPNGRPLNKEERLAIALNCGNESNLQRLLGGERYTMDQIVPILRTLTDVDWNFVEGVWDHFETYKPMVAELERKLNGKEPDWIEPKPFEIKTADGTTRTIKGGYYPVKFDPAAGPQAKIFEDVKDVKSASYAAHGASTTRRGYVKARVEEVHDKPLLLNMNGMYSGFAEVIHDLAWREWLIDANRFMANKEIDKAIRDKYGAPFVDGIRDWIKRIAGGTNSDNVGGVFNFFRHKAVASTMAWKVATLWKHAFDISKTASILGADKGPIEGWKYVFNSAGHVFSNYNEAIKEAFANSPELRHRFNTRFRELNEIKNAVAGQSKYDKFMYTHGLIFHHMLWKVTDVWTWHAAAKKYIANGFSNEEAYAMANRALIDSQGSGTVGNLSAVEGTRSPSMKLFTALSHYMINTSNILYVKTKTRTPGAAGTAKLVADYLQAVTVPVIYEELMRHAIMGLFPNKKKKKEEETVGLIMKEFAMAHADYLLGSVPIAREMSSGIKELFGIKTAGYQGPFGLKIIPDTILFARQAHQKEFDAEFRRAAIRLLGDGTGFPASQLNSTIDGIEAMFKGETMNPFAPILGTRH